MNREARNLAVGYFVFRRTLFLKTLFNTPLSPEFQREKRTLTLLNHLLLCPNSDLTRASAVDHWSFSMICSTIKFRRPSSHSAFAKKNTEPWFQKWVRNCNVSIWAEEIGFGCQNNSSKTRKKSHWYRGAWDEMSCQTCIRLESQECAASISGWVQIKFTISMNTALLFVFQPHSKLLSAIPKFPNEANYCSTSLKKPISIKRWKEMLKKRNFYSIKGIQSKNAKFKTWTWSIRSHYFLVFFHGPWTAIVCFLYFKMANEVMMMDHPGFFNRQGLT